jgi:hypothetical protein
MPIQYKTLNDTLPHGTIEVWYMKPEHFRDGITGAKPEAEFLDRTHTLLGKVGSWASTPQPVTPELLDKLWQALQGERWSPNGEARSLIHSKGLKHTSMSVGDCFKLNNDDVWIVAAEGFEQVE